jgi:hypothetical protein
MAMRGIQPMHVGTHLQGFNDPTVLAAYNVLSAQEW